MMSSSLRPALLAGQWYPSDPHILGMEIDRLCDGESGKGAGGLVPHAGYRFSGPTAGCVYAALSKSDPGLILLFGTHMGAEHPPMVAMEAAWETPLGDVPMDTQLASRMCNECGMIASPLIEDNTLELQLPFIRRIFPNSTVLAISPPANDHSIETGLKAAELALTSYASVIAIGSTDLTHYGPAYGYCPLGTGPDALKWVQNENDRAFIDAAISMKPDNILRSSLDRNNACCPGAAAAATAAAITLGAQHALLAHYDTSAHVHPDDSFVGYAGIVYR